MPSPRQQAQKGFVCLPQQRFSYFEDYQVSWSPPGNPLFLGPQAKSCIDLKHPQTSLNSKHRITALHDATGLKSTPLPGEININPLRPANPIKPCYICGSWDWWWREPSRWGIGQWLCSCCHPNPNHNSQGQPALKRGIITEAGCPEGVG